MRFGKVPGVLAQIEELLPGLVAYTAAQRIASTGKRKNGEHVAVEAIFAMGVAKPHYFVDIADKDHGVDPTKFEPQALVDLEETCGLIRTAVAQIAVIVDKLSDTQLHAQAQAQGPSSAMYRIAEPIAVHNQDVATLLAPAVEFYRAIGRKSAATRKKNKEKAMLPK